MNWFRRLLRWFGRGCGEPYGAHPLCPWCSSGLFRRTNLPNAIGVEDVFYCGSWTRGGDFTRSNTCVERGKR